MFIDNIVSFNFSFQIHANKNKYFYLVIDNNIIHETEITTIRWSENDNVLRVFGCDLLHVFRT